LLEAAQWPSGPPWGLVEAEFTTESSDLVFDIDDRCEVTAVEEGVPGTFERGQ